MRCSVFHYFLIQLFNALLALKTNYPWSLDLFLTKPRHREEETQNTDTWAKVQNIQNPEL